MSLSYPQKRQLYEQGYTLLPGVLPRRLIHAALHRINHSLGSEGIDPARLTIFRTQSYCPEVKPEPAITDLVNTSPVWEALESAIGRGNVQRPGGAQIALRFPVLKLPDKPMGCHIDGTHAPNNGVPAGEIYSFTALAVCLLSDLPDPNCGNFTVWPGTHRQHEQYFRDQGGEALVHGIPDLPRPEPVQITGRAGDVVLTHYLLAHSVAPHVGPHVRYAVIFRIKHVNHDQWKLQTLTNLWHEWDGMRELEYEASPVI